MAQAEDGLPLRLISEAAKLASKVVLPKNPIFAEAEVAGEEEEKKGGDVRDPTIEIPLQPETIQMYDFTKKTLIQDSALKDLTAFVIVPTGEQPVKLVPVLVENPPVEFLIQARV